jgi:sodium-dependent dicarboxylate transporter 2/3/5
VAVFSATGIINRNDLKKLNWDILWLMAGGIALGMGLEESGLARHVVEALPLSGWAPAGVVLAAAALTLLMANIMSHTATANLLLPLFMTAGAALPGLEGLGGTRTLILAATFAASLGMCLPISTPPNAIAHGTGAVETRHLLKTGAVIGLVGLAGVFGMLTVLKAVGFL